MIKNIFLDLDDTILDFQQAEAIALSKTLTLLGLNPTNEIVSRYSQINAEQWRLLEEEKCTREQVLINRFKILFLEFDINCSGLEAKEKYEYLLGIGHYFIPNALDILETLHTQYNLYLASNGTSIVQASRIKSAGIEKFFKEIFISEHIGYNKPSLAFFEHCFDKITDFSKDETIIIGDSLTSDIKGGNNAEIYTCWFNPNRNINNTDILPDYEIIKLTDISKVINNIKKVQK
jgi:HAD superfamily (subfamily IA) hydrolase, TIGR02254